MAILYYKECPKSHIILLINRVELYIHYMHVFLSKTSTLKITKTIDRKAKQWQKNANLSNAKKAKNDEFYTRLEDIEKELNEYDPAVFKAKVIFCNCDDPTSSNFWVFFHMNFNRLGLKKLITTHYNMDGSPSYAMEYSSKNPKDDIDFSKGTKIPLKGDGDFRSDECVNLLKQSDMVVTNPPFSLAREYVAELEKYDKQFIIIGDLNWITYKEIFPLIKDNKLWLGYTKVKEFQQPDGTYKKFGNKLWYTNIDTKKCHQKLETVYRWRKRKEKYPGLYPKYDNYDAIEVSKVLQIPLDYTGTMGVPITFLGKYNHDQFEILGITDRQNTSGLRTKKYTADDSKKYNDLNSRGVVNKDGKYKAMYARILVRNKHPEDYMNNRK